VNLAIEVPPRTNGESARPRLPGQSSRGKAFQVVQVLRGDGVEHLVDPLNQWVPVNFEPNEVGGQQRDSVEPLSCFSKISKIFGALQSDG
jgi:hypothetical protein